MTPVAHAQTWVPSRSTPVLLEIAAVDATGEPNWPFGAEDVAGDGLDRFRPQEQAIDFRTVYAVASQTDFWVRAYVSSSSNVGTDVRMFVFVDNDRNATTGGPATFASLDSRLDADPTAGGYEYVIAVGSDEELEGIWRWSTVEMDYQPIEPPQVEVETGTDRDPIRIGATSHAYLQLAVPLSTLELTSSCQAHLFVRSLNDAPSLGPGDLEVGQRGQCVPATGGDRRAPEVIVPPDECTQDAHCPAGGLCVERRCVIPDLCWEDAHCRTGEVCEEGICVFESSSISCSSDAECGDLVCDTGQSLCTACSNDASCGAGRRCALTGRCVDGSDGVDPGGSGGPNQGSGDDFELRDGETIQGGAFTCGWVSSWRGAFPGLPLWGLSLGSLVLGYRRSRRTAGVYRGSRTE